MELLFRVLILIPPSVFLLTCNPCDAHPAMEWCLSQVDWPVTDGLVCTWPVTSLQIWECTNANNLDSGSQ